MNVFRRLPLSRLLLLCAIVIAAGVSATAIASALDPGPTPPSKPLAQAVHDALTGPSVEGVSARIKLTDHLLEGASLASGSGQGGELASSPLITGASGRLWASRGHLRLELQSEKGDTQVLYDGSTVEIYDAASNSLYRYKLPAHEGAPPVGEHSAAAPSVAKVEEAISHLKAHVDLSEAHPTDVGGQAAYTVRVSPREAGSLIGGAELSFDASNGLPLRAAVYSSTSPSPVIELASEEVSYGPVASSVFSFTAPASAKLTEIAQSKSGDSAAATDPHHGANRPSLTTRGKGPATIAVLEAKKATTTAGSSSQTLEGLPKVSINGTSASELRTALGTVLSFERAGVRYVVAGAVEPGAVEAVARGL